MKSKPASNTGCMGSHLVLVFESGIVGTILTSLALIVRIVASE